MCTTTERFILGKGSNRRSGDNHALYVSNFNRIFRKEEDVKKEIWCTVSSCDKWHSCSKAYSEEIANSKPEAMTCGEKTECFVSVG